MLVEREVFNDNHLQDYSHDFDAQQKNKEKKTTTTTTSQSLVTPLLHKNIRVTRGRVYFFLS